MGGTGMSSLLINGQIGLDYGYGLYVVDCIPTKTKQRWSFMFCFGSAAD